jgi:hypothetical protein
MARGRLNEDALAGILFIACGAVGLWISRDLAAGTADAMGPGYLPRVLCFCMICLGFAISARGFVKAGQLEAWKFRPLVTILGSIIVFAAALPIAGLFAAAVLTVVVAAFGMKESRFLEVLALAAGSAVFAVLVFIYALGLPMNPWPY